MEEQVLPIGIDSEVEHVQSEIDRSDAILTVPTGPKGHQEINYHISDEETRSSYKSTTVVSCVINHESPRDKSQTLLLQDRHPIEHFDREISNKFQENHLVVKTMLHKTFDDSDNKTRFSLPEIDSSNQQEKKYPIRKDINNIFQHTRKEQPAKFSQMTKTNKEQESFPFLLLTESTSDIPQQCQPKLNNILQQQAESLLSFYTLNELGQHNDSTDGWICIFGYIYDVTSLIRKAQGTKLYQQLIGYTGQDISSLFDEITHEPRRRIDQQTYKSISVTENLSLLETFGTPFWRTRDLYIGQLSKNPRYIRLLHTFSPNHPYILEIAEENTIGQIAIKFLKYNSHIFSYLWRYNGQILDFNKTLTENGLPNEEFFHDKYGWRSDNENCPTILLYFSDDLTIA